MHVCTKASRRAWGAALSANYYEHANVRISPFRISTTDPRRNSQSRLLRSRCFELDMLQELSGNSVEQKKAKMLLVLCTNARLGAARVATDSRAGSDSLVVHD